MTAIKNALSGLVEDGTLTETEGRHFADGFLITEGGRYLGVGTSQSLLRVITQMQIESARYANPLTLMPGNVPTDKHLDALLHVDAAGLYVLDDPEISDARYDAASRVNAYSGKSRRAYPS